MGATYLNADKVAELLNTPGSDAGKKFDERLSVDSKDHREYVQLVDLFRQYYETTNSTLWQKTLDWWDLFLAIQEDKRDPVDENWRSDVFVPLPYAVTRTKAAQLTKTLGDVEPVWQVEATRETGPWYDDSRHIERLVENAHRANSWRKLLYKLAIARSVQGSAFMKMIWAKRSHVATLTPGAGEWQRFTEALQNATQLGAPQPPSWSTEPQAFGKWVELVNKAGRFGRVPFPPSSGPTEIVEYEGPVFQYVPIWQLRFDPNIDELTDQKFVIHRMVKPLSYVVDRADNDPNSNKPYILDNVKAAMGGWNGKVLEDEEIALSEKMGLNPPGRNNPYYQNAVDIQEIWSPGEPFVYTIVMNRKYIINKRPFERPLLTMNPNLFALRNVVVPGQFFGLSDYQEPEKLFKELNQFRRLRMDGATLAVLPAFVKQAGITLNEAMKKIRPGMLITLPQKDAIQSLIRHNLPPEAYREPAEIKAEIEETTETYSSVKGAPATIGRVTGQEFAARDSHTLLKYAVDAGFVEEELKDVPATVVGLYALFGKPEMRLEIGGDPDAVVSVTRSQLINALSYRFRMRGATKHIQPDLQVQQLTTALKMFGGDLQPPERRAALQLILELLDIRGWSKILSPEGGSAVAGNAQTAQNATNASNVATTNAAQASTVPAPTAPQPPQPAPPAPGQGGPNGGAQ